MRHLVYGSLNIDKTYRVPHILREGETLPSLSMQVNAGGKGANQAAALAKAGVEVFFAGKTGGDAQFVLDSLRSYGINLEYLTRYSGPSGEAIIQVDPQGLNCILLAGGGNAAITVEEIEATLASFSSGDRLVLQNEIAHVPDLIRLGAERGMQVVFNPSPCTEAVLDYPLQLVDLFFVNRTEGAFLAGDQLDLDAEEMLDRLAMKYPRAMIVLTDGKRGAYCRSGGKTAKGDVIDLPVADTTGAGDTFTGFFLGALGRELPLDEALAVACAASSIAVSRPGAMAAIPDWAEAEALVEKTASGS